MECLKHEHSVRKMAKSLEIKESVFYQWGRREGARKEKRHEEEKLVEDVRRVFDAFRQVCGYRKMTTVPAA
ncbi:MAG TPA: hypothetical protein DEB24_01340 [Coriobacteriia bacterium]|nr:hypothetical protein [Coriobacteriia bacterium]